MSKIVRALFISLAATGAAALVLSKVQQSSTKLNSGGVIKDSLEVQADTLSESEVTRLTDELGAML